MKKFVFVLCATIYLFMFSSCRYDVSDTPSDTYFPEVRTIIHDNCLSCHSSSGTWLGRPVSFDDDAAIAEQYMLIKATVADPVTIMNRRMPQDGMLTDHEIEVIIKWYDKGGKITD